jgi:16S rRNA (adenine1518-N6/adenine1519-N6)-dimethyltransferase
VSKTHSRKKKLGQCFLNDQNVLELEARLADVKGKRVLEIGAGDGRLTRKLLANNPRKLTVVEMDPFYASELRIKLGSRIEVIEGDVLEENLPEADVIVGNIPYYISSDILFMMAGMKIERAVLMVQKEFALRMAAKPKEKNYGRLSVTAQLAFQITYERAVLRHLFSPAPEVDSAIILLRPSGKKLSQLEENVIRFIFQHKNKTVRNALLDSKFFNKDELGALGGFAKRRGRTLTKEECLEIAKLLKNL